MWQIVKNVTSNGRWKPSQRGKTEMVAPALKYESNWTESYILVNHLSKPFIWESLRNLIFSRPNDHSWKLQRAALNQWSKMWRITESMQHFVWNNDNCAERIAKLWFRYHLFTKVPLNNLPSIDRVKKKIEVRVVQNRWIATAIHYQPGCSTKLCFSFRTFSSDRENFQSKWPSSWLQHSSYLPYIPYSFQKPHKVFEIYIF